MNEDFKRKIYKIQRQVIVKKDGLNPHFGNSYITLESLVEVTDKLFSENDLLLINTSHKDGIETAIHDLKSDDYISSFFPLSATDPQKVGSAITYARRYNLCCLLNIVADRDTDRDTDGETDEKKPQLTNHADVGSTMINVGKKYKGKMLKDVPKEELKGFVKWMESQDKINKDGKAFIEAANLYLKGK